MDAAKKTPIWVCDACAAKHFPAVKDSLGKCPSCGCPNGTVKHMTDAERNGQ